LSPRVSYLLLLRGGEKRTAATLKNMRTRRHAMWRKLQESCLRRRRRNKSVRMRKMTWWTRRPS
jgi:hypothetical protein